MNPDILADVAKLSNQELLAKILILARHEREATTALIAHLAILDGRQLYLGEGCSSLFTYCTQVLHFSEHAAYNRIGAARAARKYPVILELLAEGSVNLAAVRLLAPELTPANHRGLLEAATHKIKRQVEELVAGLRPLASVPSIIRRLPSPHHIAVASTVLDVPVIPEGGGDVPAADGAPDLTLAPAALSRGRPAVVAPLAPERYKVQFTASAETHAKLRLAQDLLRHQIPDGDLGQIIDRALTVLLRDLEKQKDAATDRPRGSNNHGSQGRANRGHMSHDPGTDGRPVLRSRHIPAEVRRTVWARDGGRCAFVAPNGRRCAEQGFLEFHHVVPYGVGGEATVDNIQLRCRAHNGHEAELYFGQRMSVAGRKMSPCRREILTLPAPPPSATARGSGRSAGPPPAPSAG